MGSSFLRMLYDICYLLALCTVIFLTFFVVFLPQQTVIATVYSQTIPVLQSFQSAELAPHYSGLLCIISLLYLKCIWKLIHQ